MTTNLQTFNVFGMMRVTHNHVAAIGTAITQDNEYIKQTVNMEIPAQPGIPPDGDPVVILFAATLEPDNKSRIALQNLSDRAGGSVVDPAVTSRVLKRLMSKFR